MELGGRLSTLAKVFLEEVALAQAREELLALREAAVRRWYARWVTMLSVAAQNAVAATLVTD
eukprot:9455026-Karenia_brevis.AAC.1